MAYPIHRTFGHCFFDLIGRLHNQKCFYAETTAPPSPSIGEAQEREIKNKEFQIWLISNILNRSSYWRLSSGQEGPENEQRLFELDPQQKAAAEATALEYITTTYSDHVILRAWNVAQTVDDGSCRLIRKRLKDLSVPTSDPDNRRLIDLGWRAGLSYDFLPEFFNIITSWCEDRDFDYHSAQIRDLGCREMLESLDDFFPDSKRWVRSYSYWVGGPSLIEPLPLSARFGLHKEVQEWLTDHHEAKSWWIQQREKVLQKRIQAETEVLQRFTQGSHTLSGSDHDVREAAYFLHGNKLGAADLSAEFPFELSNRTGLCAPKKTSSPAAPP